MFTFARIFGQISHHFFQFPKNPNQETCDLSNMFLLGPKLPERAEVPRGPTNKKIGVFGGLERQEADPKIVCPIFFLTNIFLCPHFPLPLSPKGKIQEIIF